MKKQQQYIDELVAALRKAVDGSRGKVTYAATVGCLELVKAEVVMEEVDEAAEASDDR
jgi:hypothetical protein